MNVYWKAVWVLAYLITAYFTFTDNMVAAMYLMAGTMLLESIVSLFETIRQKTR